MLYHSQTSDSDEVKFTFNNFLDQNEKQNVRKLQNGGCNIPLPADSDESCWAKRKRQHQQLKIKCVKEKKKVNSSCTHFLTNSNYSKK